MHDGCIVYFSIFLGIYLLLVRHCRVEIQLSLVQALMFLSKFFCSFINLKAFLPLMKLRNFNNFHISVDDFF